MKIEYVPKNFREALSNLNAAMELARDEAEDANQIFRDARDKFARLERFNNETLPTGEIGVINSEAFGSSCTILTRYYRLDGRMVLFTVTEAQASNRDIIYIGQVVDYDEKTVLYACQFQYDDYEKKQELFDFLLVNYIEWRFDL